MLPMQISEHLLSKGGVRMGAARVLRAEVCGKGSEVCFFCGISLGKFHQKSPLGLISTQPKLQRDSWLQHSQCGRQVSISCSTSLPSLANPNVVHASGRRPPYSLNFPLRRAYRGTPSLTQQQPRCVERRWAIAHREVFFCCIRMRTSVSFGLTQTRRTRFYPFSSLPPGLRRARKTAKSVSPKENWLTQFLARSSPPKRGKNTNYLQNTQDRYISPGWREITPPYTNTTTIRQKESVHSVIGRGGRGNVAALL